MPKKQPIRGRLWLNDGSCVRLRAEHRDHVLSYDFAQARTHDGRVFRMLTVIDGHTRECLAIDAARSLKSDGVLEPGSPWENGYIESFNGKLRDELLNGEVFTTLRESKVLIEQEEA